jgi:hypothetical protein
MRLIHLFAISSFTLSPLGLAAEEFRVIAVRDYSKTNTIAASSIFLANSGNTKSWKCTAWFARARRDRSDVTGSLGCIEYDVFPRKSDQKKEFYAKSTAAAEGDTFDYWTVDADSSQIEYCVLGVYARGSYRTACVYGHP